MSISVNTTRRVKYHIDHAARRIRFHTLRPFSAGASQPYVKGRIICHISDFNSSDGLAEQLQYFLDRDVMTFRIYTDRKTYVEDILHTLGINSRCSTSVNAVSRNSGEQNGIWKFVDSYNWAQSHDKWTLILNAGEYLVYPHSATRTVPDLCQFLSDEHRRALFSIILDAYYTEPNAPAFVYGCNGWKFDRYGYEFKYSSVHDTDIWNGGFTYRFREEFKNLGRRHITRIPLQKIGRKSMPTRDLKFALPPKVNAASAPLHLSPTGCILSSRCFEDWKSEREAMGQKHDFEKLVSAPALPVTWRPDDLIEFGFMNEGQWL